MFRSGLVAVLAGLLVLPSGAAGAQDPESAAAEAKPSWELVLDWLREESERFAADLETAHSALLARAEEAGAAGLVDRLEPEPPKPRPYGYAMVPRVEPASAWRHRKPTERRFSLERTSTAYVAFVRDAAVLARRAADPARPLPPLVKEFERLKSKLSNLNSQISYHAHWQLNVTSYPDLYAKRNRTVAMVREWNDLEARKDDTARAKEIRDQFEARLGRFRATKGLVIERRDDGMLVLPVRVVTDIEDEALVEEFRTAVTEAYVESEAVRARRFRVELTIERLAPSDLYPEGAPARGTKINMREHLARLPEGALAITTGVRSTYASIGGAIQLGPAATTRRTLTHEFGHLLGFNDTYLRGHNGEPGDPFGCVLVEWSGLTPDIMGFGGDGWITTDMIDQLIEAYLPKATVGSPADGPTPAAQSGR